MKLKPETIYFNPTTGEFVCGTTRCAGSTAVASGGTTIGGARLQKVEPRDVDEWAGYDLGALSCTCGARQATALAASDGSAITKEAA